MPLALLQGLLALWLFVVGLCVGSFLNVVIARVPHGLSVVRPRSRCPHCGHTLSWFENVPLLSWALLRARCRSCRAPISWRYPAVELLTGLLFLACLRRFDWTPELGSALVLICLLVPLTFIDLEHWILPFSLTLPGIAAGLGLAALQGRERLLDAAIGAAAGFLIFWLLEWVGERIFRKEALGGGDKYLLAMLGAFLSWKALLAIVFLSSFQGALIGSALLLLRGRAGPAPRESTGAETGAGASSPEEPAPTPAAPDAAAPALLEGEAAAVAPHATEEEDDWAPGPTNIPFGPWLALAALEVLLLGPWLQQELPVGLRLLWGYGP